MRLLLHSLFLILIFGCSSKTNQISKSNTDSNFENVSPESVGISSERLNRIDKYFNKWCMDFEFGISGKLINKVKYSY